MRSGHFEVTLRVSFPKSYFLGQIFFKYRHIIYYWNQKDLNILNISFILKKIVKKVFDLWPYIEVSFWPVSYPIFRIFHDPSIFNQFLYPFTGIYTNKSYLSTFIFQLFQFFLCKKCCNSPRSISSFYCYTQW